MWRGGIALFHNHHLLLPTMRGILPRLHIFKFVAPRVARPLLPMSSARIAHSPLTGTPRHNSRLFTNFPARLMADGAKSAQEPHIPPLPADATMSQRLNALPGVSCVDSPGALYLYPQIRLSDKAIEAAREAGKEPDAFYALQLLHDTGICVVPGSGFGQKEGEWHYRLTCLCPGVDEYVGQLEAFHAKFVEKYGAAN